MRALTLRAGSTAVRDTSRVRDTMRALAAGALIAALAPAVIVGAQAQNRGPARDQTVQDVGDYRQQIADALAAMARRKPSGPARTATDPSAPGAMTPDPSGPFQSGPYQSVPRRPATTQPAPDIARAPAAPLSGPFQAGPLRTARAPQPGDQAVCVRAIERGQYAYFAAFITDGMLETIRRAVGIDRCWLETGYVTLPPPRPPKTRRGDSAAGR